MLNIKGVLNPVYESQMLMFLKSTDRSLWEHLNDKQKGKKISNIP